MSKHWQVNAEITEDDDEYFFVGVKSLVVAIKRESEGVVIDIWPDVEDPQESLGGTWALYSEGEEDA